MHFRSTFIASRYKYILNKECIKGEEVEKVFSGSRVRHDWFADFLILFRGFHILYNIFTIEIEASTSIFLTINLQTLDHFTICPLTWRRSSESFSNLNFSSYWVGKESSFLVDALVLFRVNVRRPGLMFVWLNQDQEV